MTDMSAGLNVGMITSGSQPRSSHESVVTLHPALLARYEEMVGRLQQSMAEGTAAGNAEYAEVMRELVESVTVMPGDESGQVVINIKGCV